MSIFLEESRPRERYKDFNYKFAQKQVKAEGKNGEVEEQKEEWDRRLVAVLCLIRTTAELVWFAWCPLQRTKFQFSTSVQMTTQFTLVLTESSWMSTQSKC